MHLTLTASEFRSLMRRNNWTIRNLSESCGITQKRIRQIREQGVKGYVDVTAWVEMLTGVKVFDRAVYDRLMGW